MAALVGAKAARALWRVCCCWFASYKQAPLVSIQSAAAQVRDRTCALDSYSNHKSKEHFDKDDTIKQQQQAQQRAFSLQLSPSLTLQLFHPWSHHSQQHHNPTSTTITTTTILVPASCSPPSPCLFTSTCCCCCSSCSACLPACCCPSGARCYLSGACLRAPPLPAATCRFLPLPPPPPPAPRRAAPRKGLRAPLNDATFFTHTQTSTN